VNPVNDEPAVWTPVRQNPGGGVLGGSVGRGGRHCGVIKISALTFSSKQYYSIE